jgi:predicted ATP-grasp superfamily ATP-dependent carboligase
LSEPEHPAGLSNVPGCWLADLPPSGTEIPAGSPVCSVYISGKTLPEILKHVRSELVSKWLLRASGLCPDRLKNELSTSLFDTLKS